MKNIIIFVTLMLLCAASCKKDKASEDQLPAATQTGANTFGCLVNGKVFVPKGYDGTGRPNPHVQYDYDLNGKPYVSISAIQFLENSTQNYCDIVFRNLTTTGNYNFPTGFENFVAWQSLLGNCYTPAYDTTVRKWGQGVITKLDNLNRIVSGTFNCKFKHGQCDTVYITDGRFDIKF